MFGAMWEGKTILTWRAVQNQAFQRFGPDIISYQNFERFGNQIGGNVGSKFEQQTIKKHWKQKAQRGCAKRLNNGNRLDRNASIEFERKELD